ncbi:MAG: trypsin-like peptidase domain-containing protein [Kofleriaceae bacterium]|nr:trypsin-like peptidase domain-containing protein [Kofleriaceae bacterium]
MAADEAPKRRWWRKRGSDQPVPMSRVCPSCKLVGPVRLLAGQVCASCAAQQAWAAVDNAGPLVIDREAIAEVVRRREGTKDPWWRGLLAWLPTLISLAAAVFAGWALVAHLSPRPLGPLRALLDDLDSAQRKAFWIGLGATIAGIVLLVRTRRRKHFRRYLFLAAPSLAIAVGATSAVIAGFTLLFSGSYGGRFNTMPPREQLGVSAQVERIISATVVVLAPDGDGDARNLAMGSGAIVGGDHTRAWIVTCSHVAMPYVSVGSRRDPKDALPVWVQLSDGREGKAYVRWSAPPPIDVAVLELPIADPPAPVPFAADASLLEAGGDVTFVPNPYRDGWLVHRGHLLRKDAHRSPAGTYSLLVTDLPVIPGDSGSGLFDAGGRLVGLNTWVKVENGLSQGISLPTEAVAALGDAIAHDRLDQLQLEEH